MKHLISTQEMKTALGLKSEVKTEIGNVASKDKEKESRFEEGVPADPTINMTQAEKAKWEAENKKHRDKFKKADRNPKRKRLSWDKDAAKRYPVIQQLGAGTIQAALQEFTTRIKLLEKESDAVEQMFDRGGYKALADAGILSDEVAADLLGVGRRRPMDQEERDLYDEGVDSVAREQISEHQKDIQHEIIWLEGVVKGIIASWKNQKGALEGLMDLIESTRAKIQKSYNLNFTKRGSLDEPATKEASAPTGLYGYTKAVQRDCEASARKLQRFASSVAKRAYGKDGRVAEFLGTHAKRGKSLSARILVAAMKDLGPKFASEATRGYPVIQANEDDMQAIERAMMQKHKATDGQTKEARDYGMYGFPTKTARLGLDACTSLKEHAGVIASDLHRRRHAMYENITGFLREHAKQAKCHASRMILGCYPEETYKFGSRKKEEGADEDKPSIGGNLVSQWLEKSPEEFKIKWEESSSEKE